MLTYKHLLPRGGPGTKDHDIALVKKTKSRKDKLGKKRGANEALIPGLAYARKLGLSGSPVPREPPDFITQEILKESNFLPRRAKGLEDREFPLRSQISFPEGISTLRVDESGNLGLASLNYSPFKLHRVYGRTDTIPVLNLTGIHKSHIAYVAANVVIFFDYYNNRQSVLQGHKNKITCMVKDRDNRYFASGDVGKESLVIIWDIRTGYPFKRIQAAYEDYGVDSIGFVGSEDYIGTIGTEIVEETVAPSPETGQRKPSAKTVERQVVNIWYFGSPVQTVKNRYPPPSGRPVVSIVIPPSADKQLEIQFSEEIPEYFMTSGDKSLVFYTWVQSESRIIYHIPKTPKKFMSRMKGFSKSIWVNRDRCFTCTAAGFVLEFGEITPMGLQEPPNPEHNIKEYRRSYKVGEIPLSTITAYKEFFVVGDIYGNVQFFDEKFRIIRWTKTMEIGPIHSISFNHTEAQPEWKVEMQSHYEPKPRERIHAQRDGVSAVRDYTGGGHKYVQPSQTTIEKPPLFAADLVVGYTGGNTYYYHLAEGKVDQLIHGTFGQIVAIDTCPFTTHVTMCNKKGEIQMYDYLTQALLYSGKLFKKKLTITYLKFHPSGSFALFGSTIGHLFFRRSYTWKALDSPLEYGNSPIEKIVFSSCGVYVAQYDVGFSIIMYFFNTKRSLWLPKGKYRAHCRPIVDLAFLKDPTTGDQRLFSLGQDRRFIEYDVYKSNPADGLKILNISYIDQSCIPTSMVFEVPWPQHGPLVMVANNINKIKIFDQNLHKTRRTVQGPNYGTPINRMISIAPEASRNSTFIVMLLGNKIGLMKSPVDGNPFKFMAVLGHGEEHNILEAVVGCNGREVFTCAENDTCTFMWLPNIPALETCALSGGSGVLPYKHMLDAGLPPGKSIVEDVENVFYHMMMKQALTQHSMLSMSCNIHISDIPTVMRTCGFFPTEYEIETIFEEAEFLGGMKQGEKPLNISLDDFIVLFANHRTFPVSDEDVVNAFTLLGMFNDDDEISLTREDFVELLTTKGETFNALDLPSFLPSFYRSKEEVAIEQPPWLKKVQDPDEKPTLESSKSDYASGTTPSLEDEDESPKLKIAGAPTSPTSPKPETKTSNLELEKPDLNPNIEVIHMTPSRSSLMYSEDGSATAEGLFYGSSSYTFIPNHEMPEEITAKFFIKELLTAESRDTINWLHASGEEEQALSKIFEAAREVDSWDEILNRWKGRDEWRYFNRIFDLFRRRDVSLDKKLEAAMEMDYYCRTGTWPEPRQPKSQEEAAEEEVAGETDKSGESHEDESEEEEVLPAEPEVAEEERQKSGESAAAGSVVSAEEEDEGETVEKMKKRLSDFLGGGGEEEGEFWTSESDDADVVEVDDGFPRPVENKSLWLDISKQGSAEEFGESSYLDEDETDESPPFTNLPVTYSSTGPLEDPGTELYTDMEELQLEVESGDE